MIRHTKPGKPRLMAGASLIALGLLTVSASATLAQNAPAATPATDKDNTVVVVTGQRAALKSAQKIKQTSEEIVDSIVADDIGKLPDRSVTEALQRVVGVTIDHNMTRGDPEHYSVEGSGVNIRGLSYVRSELNGRDSFSANGGRALNFEDVPPELMAGVDVYKNPSAEQTEGAIGGLVNLRTAMPFDYKGFKASVSAQGSYSELKKGKVNPSYSALVSDRWHNGAGDFGALLDIAYSESGDRTDAFQVEPYYPRVNDGKNPNDPANATDPNTWEPVGKTVWVPKGAQWRTLLFDRKRFGAYSALQWRPNDDVTTSLTFFNSHYKMKWDEQALFAQSSPYDIAVSNATYDSQGALLTGTLTDPVKGDGGINFNDDTRTATRTSDTTDISWNLTWKLSSKLTVRSDLQHIRSTTSSFDSTVATGVELPWETVDLTASPPIIKTDSSVLANPNNYYWGFTMEHFDKSLAHEWSWKGDVKYDFDHPVLKDLRVGVRLTDQDATTTNSNPGYNWAAITQPWQIGWNIDHLAYLGDPRFSGGTHLTPFNNFFNGKVSVPGVIFPDVSWATGYPASYAKLHTYHDILCAEQVAAQGWGSCDAWKPATFGTDPSGVNDQSEKTRAVYAQLKFGFDDLKWPISGTIGVRDVVTDAVAHGYIVFNPTIASVPPGYAFSGNLPTINAQSGKINETNSYNNVLPSLNLLMKVTPKFQMRLAIAKAIARPDFTQLQAYTTLSQGATLTTDNTAHTVTATNVTYTGSATGNPMLRPTQSTQVDFTTEWYFSSVGSLTMALFSKDLHDVVINELSSYTLTDTTGAPHDFVTTSPVNGANGTVKGVELAYQQYYDFLPGWLSGFGVQANFTYVDSQTKLYNPVTAAYCSGGNTATNLTLNLNGCDVDGRTFKSPPLAYLSKYTYNFALMYDRGPISARLAYNWRSKYLQAVNVNGTEGGDGTDSNPASPTYGQHNIAWGLPTWADDYGQLDGSFLYKFGDKLTLGLEAQNLNNAMWRQVMQQHVGNHYRAYFVSGARYTATIRYTF